MLPRALSARDRWRAHLLAEGWGLMHESVGEGGARRLVVWKPSRTRRSLKPEMLQAAAAHSSDSEGEGGGGEAEVEGGNAEGMAGAGVEHCGASAGGSVEAAI